MSEVRGSRKGIYVNHKHQKTVSHLPSVFLTDDFLDSASQKMLFSENRSGRKYIDVNDTIRFTDAPDRGIGGFGLAGKKSMCFHVAFRFTRIFLRYTVHMHVEEEFQNLIPGFRTN